MPAIKLYRRRWLMLAIFATVSMTNGYQWIQYSTIANIVTRFYDTSSQAVNWTSQIYMLCYVFVFGANYLVDRYGVWLGLMLGAFGNAFAAWIKVWSAAGDRFWLTFLAQTLAGSSQIFILGMPSFIAASWFAADEVATATALGVFGNSLGIAIGFLLPPLFVPKPEPWDQQAVAKDLRIMFLSTAIACTLIFTLVVFVFRSAPPTPPSHARAAANTTDAVKKDSELRILWKLMTNTEFILLFLSYGILVGVSYAVQTLLNPTILNYFPGEEVNVGRIGLLIVISGLLGAVLAGFWLDRTHTYWLTSTSIYILTLASTGLFLTALHLNKLWLIFVVSGILGFFMMSYLPLGFEYGSELTYPLSEASTSGMLNIAAQIGGISLTEFTSVLNDELGYTAGLLMLCIMMAVGSFLTALIKEDLRRQRAEKARTIESVGMKARYGSVEEGKPNSRNNIAPESIEAQSWRF